MAVFPQIKRFLRLDRRLKEKRFPNASHLAAQSKISQKTALPDIMFWRDRLRAPIAYALSRKGY
jgi:hypothetical protein